MPGKVVANALIRQYSLKKQAQIKPMIVLKVIWAFFVAHL
jgi:hypothetical protein